LLHESANAAVIETHATRRFMSPRQCDRGPRFARADPL
jgi:hypothetical protein